MNRELLELLRRIEEGSRRLAATIVHCYDKPVQDIELARTELEDITSALNSFKAHVAAGERIGAVPGRRPGHVIFTVSSPQTAGRLR